MMLSRCSLRLESCSKEDRDGVTVEGGSPIRSRRNVVEIEKGKKQKKEEMGLQAASVNVKRGFRRTPSEARYCWIFATPTTWADTVDVFSLPYFCFQVARRSAEPLLVCQESRIWGLIESDRPRLRLEGVLSPSSGSAVLPVWLSCPRLGKAIRQAALLRTLVAE